MGQKTNGLTPRVVRIEIRIAPDDVRVRMSHGSRLDHIRRWVGRAIPWFVMLVVSAVVKTVVQGSLSLVS